jgi:hypothetical protein
MHFPVPTLPIFGESLMGYVARASDESGHVSVQHALAMAGLPLCRAELLQRREVLDAAKFAQFFGCERSQIEARLHPRVEIANTRSVYLDFFGSPVRALCVEQKLRRVAPTSLIRSPHHHAMWSVKPLTFCAETRELLIDHCPSCRRALGWKKAFGIQYCEHCIDPDANPTTDLRDYPQAKLADEWSDQLLFISGLINPDPGVRDDARRLLPESLACYPNWQIFDLATILAFIHIRRDGTDTNIRLSEACRHPDWTSSFAFSSRVVLEWPHSALNLIESLRSTASTRSGFFGITKELGPLAGWGRPEGLQPQLCDEIERAVLRQYGSVGRADTRSSYHVDAPNDYIRYNKALQKYGLTSKDLSSLVASRAISTIRTDGAKRAPVYIHETELAAAVDLRAHLVPLTRLASFAGIPPMLVTNLATEGHVKLETGPASKLRGPGPWIRNVELQDFVSRLEAGAASSRPFDLALRTAIRIAGLPSSEIVAILTSIVGGRLRYSVRAGIGPVFSRILVDPRDLSAHTPYSRMELPEKVTIPECAIIVDCRRAAVQELLNAGYFEPYPYGTLRQIQGHSVEKFLEEYITGPAATTLLRLGAHQRLGSFLRAHGVRHHWKGRHVTLWHRADVTGHLR